MNINVMALAALRAINNEDSMLLSVQAVSLDAAHEWSVAATFQVPGTGGVITRSLVVCHSKTDAEQIAAEVQRLLDVAEAGLTS